MNEEYPEGSAWHLAMKPSVQQANPDDPIPIYDGKMEFCYDEDKVTETGEVCLAFVPSGQITFRVASPTAMPASDTKYMALAIPECRDSALVLVTESGMSFGAGVQYHPMSGLVQAPLLFGEDQPLGRVMFHLVNFSLYQGERIHIGNSGGGYRAWSGRTTFALGPWQVTIDSLPDAEARLKKARDVGGYVITHVGRLERREIAGCLPKLFKPAAACKALEVLGFVFTFARGARCPCYLPFGYRHMETYILRCVDSPKVAPASYGRSWFAEHAPSRSFAFANRLYELWGNPDEQSWLRSAINLYAAANHNLSGVDIELAKSQIALELLAWEIAEERQQLLSREAFEHLPAADKIRIALHWASVSTEIPATMTELAAALPLLKDGELGPHDGPFAVTQIRNATIHATRAKRNRQSRLTSMAQYEAWHLCQMYVELLILRLLDYRGPYEPRYAWSRDPTSRLWHIVPWVDATRSTDAE